MSKCLHTHTEKQNRKKQEKEIVNIYKYYNRSIPRSSQRQLIISVQLLVEGETKIRGKDVCVCVSLCRTSKAHIPNENKKQLEHQKLDRKERKRESG